MISYNSKGILTTRLFEGSDEDLNGLIISVKIIDNFGGSTDFIISYPIYVYPDQKNIYENLNSFLNNDPGSSFYLNTLSNNVPQQVQTYMMIANSINILSSNDPQSLDKNLIANIRNSLVEKIDTLTPQRMSDISLVGSALASVSLAADELTDKSIVRITFHSILQL